MKTIKNRKAVESQNVSTSGSTATETQTAPVAPTLETQAQPDAPIVPISQPSTVTEAQQAEIDAKAKAKAEIDALYNEVKETLAVIAQDADNVAFAKYRNLFGKVSSFMLPRPNFKELAGAQGDTDSAKLVRKNALEKCKTHNHPYSGAIKMLSAYALKRWDAESKEKATMRQLKSGSVAVRSSKSVTLKASKQEFRAVSVSV